MNKKESIVSSALKLLTQKGVHATPMSAIAKDAGTGMGTIYNYYATKEILINEIYKEIKIKEESLFENFSNDLPIKTQFETYYRISLLFFLENPLYFQFMEQLHASPIITNESRKVGQKAIDCVLQLVESGKKDRIIKNIKTDELMQFVGGSIFSCIRWYLSETNENKQISLNNQLQMVWDAIKE